jgi:hypothetical protein
MHEPDVVVEHGTGLGVSTLMLGQAAKENGHGRVYSFDNGSGWQPFLGRPQTSDIREDPRFQDLFTCSSGQPSYQSFLRSLLDAAELSEQIECIDASIDYEIASIRHPSSPLLQPLMGQRIDMLYADVSAGPLDLVRLLANYLPILSETASVFFDSLPTFLESYWALEQIVSQLQANKLPRALTMGADQEWIDSIQRLILQRKFTLVHLVEINPKSGQNSVAWLKIEPVDILPYPLGNFSLMGGVKVKREVLVDMYQTGQCNDMNLLVEGMERPSEARNSLQRDEEKGAESPVATQADVVVP